MLEQGSNQESDPETREILPESNPSAPAVTFTTTQFHVEASQALSPDRRLEVLKIIGRNRWLMPVFGVFMSVSAGICVGGIVVNNFDRLQAISGQGDARLTPETGSLYPELTATPNLAELTAVSGNEPGQPGGDDDAKKEDPGNGKPADGDQPPQQTLPPIPTRTATSTPTPTRTATLTPKPTDTPNPTNTPRPTLTPPPSATPRPQPSATPRPLNSNTPVRTATPGPTETVRPSNTPVRTATLQPTQVPSATPRPTASATPQRTNTVTVR